MVLSTSVEEHGVEVVELPNVDRLESAYKKGYLHSAYTDEDEHTLYDFPTNLHHRCVLSFVLYLAACGPKGQVSGSAAAETTAVGLPRIYFSCPRQA